MQTCFDSVEREYTCLANDAGNSTEKNILKEIFAARGRGWLGFGERRFGRLGSDSHGGWGCFVGKRGNVVLSKMGGPERKILSRSAPAAKF